MTSLPSGGTVYPFIIKVPVGVNTTLTGISCLVDLTAIGQPVRCSNNSQAASVKAGDMVVVSAATPAAPYNLENFQLSMSLEKQQ